MLSDKKFRAAEKRFWRLIRELNDCPKNSGEHSKLKLEVERMRYLLTGEINNQN